MSFRFALATMTLTIFGCTGETATDTDDKEDTEVEVNEPPVAVDDLATLFAGGTTQIDVRENDDDPEDDSLKISEITQGEYGVVEIIDSQKLVEYTALDAEYTGTDEFSYTIYDEGGNTDSATVTIAITDRPTLTITSPIDDDVITATEVEITFEVTGCNFTSPSYDPDGCHAHKYLDEKPWYDEKDSNFGVYAVQPFSIYPLTEGEHTFRLSMAMNDGSDALFEPRIEDSFVFSVVLESAR